MSKTFQRRCMVGGCKKKYYAKGYCNAHYNRARLGTDLTRPWNTPDPSTTNRVNDGECSFDGCDRPAHTKGLCRTHYMQLWMNNHDWSALKPIRVYTDVKRDETGQLCRTCDKRKPWTEFYKRSDSDAYQTECRSCQRDRRSRNWQNKNGDKRQRKFQPRRRRVE